MAKKSIGKVSVSFDLDDPKEKELFDTILLIKKNKRNVLVVQALLNNWTPEIKPRNFNETALLKIVDNLSNVLLKTPFPSHLHTIASSERSPAGGGIKTTIERQELDLSFINPPQTNETSTKDKLKSMFNSATESFGGEK